MAEDYNYEDTLIGQKMTREERYDRMVDYMNTIPDFNYHNGIKLTALRDGYAECRAVLTPDSENAQGMAHGGLIFSLCDVAASYAAAYIDRRCVTQSAGIHFLRPARGSCLVARAEPIKVGKTVSVVTARAYDDEERLVAEATFSLFYL
ncbi:MAG: PaaI family thioesterase [Oscillospiraceae bacterium]|jgi:acyl-CoA thioesterase|nr:PaaI family thioesterase [Oscillospiraceae bacterium]